MLQHSPGTQAHSQPDGPTGGSRECVHPRHDFADGSSGHVSLVLVGLETGRQYLQCGHRCARRRIFSEKYLDALNLAGGQLPVVVPLKQIEFVRCHL